MPGMGLIMTLVVSLFGAEPLWPDVSRLPPVTGGGENDVAVVVAVEDYFALPAVRGAGELGVAWFNYLRNVRKVPLVVLVRDKKATANGIRDAVEKIRGKAKTGGRAWFIFIGHGAPSEDGRDGVLVGVSAQATQRDFFPNTVARGEILRLLASAGGSEPPVVVIDACFSGTDVQGKTLITDAQFAVSAQLLETKEATVLTAGRAGDIAGSLPGGSGPAFGYLLLGALRGWGDQDGDGVVTTEEAVQYAQDALLQLDPSRQQQPQHSGVAQVLVGRKGSKLEHGPDIGDIVLRLSGGVTTSPAGNEEMLEKLAALEKARTLREEAEAAEAAAKAAAAKSHQAEVDQLWAKVKAVAEGGGPEGKEAVELFLKRYANHPLGNPRAAEATAMLERFKPKPSDGPRASGGSNGSGGSAGSAGSKGPSTLQWVYSAAAKLYFSRSEVTVAQYRACVEAGACTAANYGTASYCNWGRSDRDQHPMNCVNWHGADQFCTWAGGRLPTEAEWYAEASNGGARKYPWGDAEVTCDRAIWGDGSNTDGCGQDHTWPVCSKPAGNSVSGLCDMSGNVWEWTSSQEGTGRVLRGGSWNGNGSTNLQASARARGDPGSWFGSRGVRCVRVSQ